MHYYQFNIGDYAKATRHLTNLEDLAYRRLIELYYDTEKPLENEPKKLARLINMRENIAEIEAVLSDFFVLSEAGFYQSRIESEIEKFHAKADSARVNGKKGGRPKKPKQNPTETQAKPKKTQPVKSANPEKSGSKANQEPRTKNQEPITNVLAPLLKIGMSESQAIDCQAIRTKNAKTAKAAKITERIAGSLANEFDSGFSANFTFDQMLAEWELAGWQSFKFEWFLNRIKTNKPHQPQIGIIQSPKIAVKECLRDISDLDW